MMMTLFSASIADCRVLMMELVSEKLYESVHSVPQSDVCLCKCMAGDRWTGECRECHIALQHICVTKYKMYLLLYLDALAGLLCVRWMYSLYGDTGRACP